MDVDILQKVLSRRRRKSTGCECRDEDAKRPEFDSLFELIKFWSQVELTASAAWQTPTVSFHLHDLCLRSGERARIEHRPQAAGKQSEKNAAGPELPPPATGQRWILMIVMITTMMSMRMIMPDLPPKATSQGS